MNNKNKVFMLEFLHIAKISNSLEWCSAEILSVGIQLENFVLIARIYFFILPPLSLLNVLEIHARQGKEIQEKDLLKMLQHQVHVGLGILYVLQFSMNLSHIKNSYSSSSCTSLEPK
jgi:uncharacterized protein YqfB (UPF0267 family)